MASDLTATGVLKCHNDDGVWCFHPSVLAEANTMLSQVVLHTSALPEEPEAGAALQMDASVDTT